MAPKKDKGKSDAPAVKPGAFTEVEKVFLEQQLAESNRKVARLRSAVDEYELRNEELQKAYDKLDEDRADIIAFLKKSLNNKSEENIELKDKVKGLEETREIETAQFKETVAELERNFTIMKDQLTSENKLLAGKLNTLEEFRAIRDDLMRKYEKQEQDFKDQEMKYKRIIYDGEKKFVVGKDKLKKEMEGRLLQLAQDFQDATELRIAASTHRVIRENIAINNELDSILATQTKLAEQNENYKKSEQAARVAMELAEEERDKAINKSVVQLKVIDQLTTAFQNMQKDKALMEKRNFDLNTLQTKIQHLTKENESLSLQVRILEQNLHGKLNEQNKSLVEASKIAKESKKMKNILREAAIAIQAALKLDQWAVTDTTREIMDRQVLLSRLLEIVTQYRDALRAESMDSLASLGKIYEEGDLGFVPKRVAKKSVTSIPSTASKTSRGSPKRASVSSSVSSSTLGSVKTMPSIQIIPFSSEVDLPTKESVMSFATSTKSVESSESEEESVDEATDIEKMLEQSKLEIQKSILKDLAYSRSQVLKSKTVVIQEGVETEHIEGEGVEGEGVEGEGEGEHVKGEMVEGEESEAKTVDGDGEDTKEEQKEE
ncbi:cilia- and flagella-associated protein 157 [Cydia strobilella]|uniref:cilia- and flagella-associated protein 157 n=1 Tax=Cydia strobilella TaxID=1100964 RepID=UPI00300420B3